jgi:ketopantoate reductase
MHASSSYTVLVTGLGALGTVFVTLLKKAGWSVLALTKDKYLSDHPDRRVRITGIWGEHEAVLDGIYSSIVPLKKGKHDLIILTVKSYDTAAAIEQVKPLMGKDTLIIIAQHAILWDKILYNAALNPLGAVLECTYGQLAENVETRQIMNAIIGEIFRVVQAHGMPLNWKSADEYRKHFYTSLVPPTSKHFSSMYHDVKVCKRLEIDALNGAVVKLPL